ISPSGDCRLVGLTAAGYVPLTDEVLAAVPEISIGMAALVRCMTVDDFGVSDSTIPSSFPLRVAPGASPPTNGRLEQLLADVRSRKAKCSHAEVPLALVTPEDARHALEIPEHMIRAAEQVLDSGRDARLLVYWDAPRLVSGDDYGAYMAYRRRGVRHVPVA